MNKKEFLKEDIKEFQTCFYNYLSEEIQNVLDHLKQDLPTDQQKEIERVANELEYLAEEIRSYNKCINELLFNEKEKENENNR